MIKIIIEKIKALIKKIFSSKDNDKDDSDLPDTHYPLW